MIATSSFLVNKPCLSTSEPTCRTQYLGEWSAACAMGLITGLVILILQRYLNPDVVHQLLTFNPADFFTCGRSLRASLCLHSGCLLHCCSGEL